MLEEEVSTLHPDVNHIDPTCIGIGFRVVFSEGTMVTHV